MSATTLTTPHAGAQQATLCWYSDSGHAWLAVDFIEFDYALEFASQYSYIDNKEGVVYLEEDCDAPNFIHRYSINLDSIQFYTVDGESEIRNLPRGKAQH